MNFSIKSLLALILLGALLTNWLMLRQLALQHQSEAEQARAEFQSLRAKTERVAQYTEYFDSAILGESTRLSRYEAVLESNADLPLKLHQLKIVDPDAVSTLKVPLLKDGTLVHHAFRVYIPESKKIAIHVEFINAERWVSESSTAVCSLKAGEQIIDFQIDWESKKELALFVNEERKLTRKLRTQLNGYSSQSTAGQRDVLNLSKPVRLVRIKPSLKHQDDANPEVVITLVESGQQKVSQ